MLKGRKLSYAERWASEKALGGPAFSSIKGKKLLKLVAEIRREHRTRRKD